jgi:hypothetical protein
VPKHEISRVAARIHLSVGDWQPAGVPGVGNTDGVAKRLRDDEESDDLDHHEEAVRLISPTARESVSPLDRLETALHPDASSLLHSWATAALTFSPSCGNGIVRSTVAKIASACSCRARRRFGSVVTDSIVTRV